MKTVLLYITTVLISFIGLLGILNIGETLAAPPDISGIWKVEKVSDIIHHSCLPLNIVDSELIIEQSGIYLLVQLNNLEQTRIQGKIRNNRVSLTGVIPTEANAAKCGEETKFRLDLKLNIQQENRNQLSGTWSTPDCSNCERIRFSAVKTPGKVHRIL